MPTSRLARKACRHTTANRCQPPTHLGVLPRVEGGQEEAVFDVQRLQGTALLERPEALGREVGGAAVAREAACNGEGRWFGWDAVAQWGVFLPCGSRANRLPWQPSRGSPLAMAQK